MTSKSPGKYDSDYFSAYVRVSGLVGHADGDPEKLRLLADRVAPKMTNGARARLSEVVEEAITRMTTTRVLWKAQ